MNVETSSSESLCFISIAGYAIEMDPRWMTKLYRFMVSHMMHDEYTMITLLRRKNRYIGQAASGIGYLWRGSEGL